MKILLCSNTFEHIHHGPAKFANIILEINDRYPEHEIRILTEDVSKPTPYVHKVNLKIPAFLHVFSQIFRMFVYHQHAVKMHSLFPYDVIVYNNSFIGLWSAIALYKPTVGMINDYSHLDVGLFNFKPQREWIKKIFFRQLERCSVKRHILILTNSDYLQNRVIQQYQVDDRKVFRLYKAIQLKTTFLKNKTFVEPIKILFVKADYLTGGLDVLADSLKWVPDYRFRITIIGPPEEFKTYVMSYFANVSNAEIVFLGSQPQSIVYEHMDTCDIFCVPSRREALGVANIEALASGISVITTNVGGVPEVMDHGRNGWLVNPEAPHELAVAIQECIEDSAKRQTLSSNGLTFIQKFSKENMIDNFIGLLTKQITC